MCAIEFQSKVKNGSISITEEYREKVTGNVRVILLAEGVAANEGVAGKLDMIEHLLENPLTIEGFKPFTRVEVYE
jgi:hypothetical protein